MSKESRTADEILKQKYEERGWELEAGLNLETRPKIQPLPFSKDEYRNFSIGLSKLAIQDRDPKLCELYFELQRRAFYRNGYSSIEGMSEIEKEMWSLGTGEVIENIEKHM